MSIARHYESQVESDERALVEGLCNILNTNLTGTPLAVVGSKCISMSVSTVTP